MTALRRRPAALNVRAARPARTWPLLAKALGAHHRCAVRRSAARLARHAGRTKAGAVPARVAVHASAVARRYTERTDNSVGAFATTESIRERTGALDAVFRVVASTL